MRLNKLRYLLILIATLAVYQECHAQIGVRFGPNISTVSDNNILPGKTYKTGIEAAVYMKYFPISKLDKFFLTNEFLVSLKGYKQELDQDYSTDLNYFSIVTTANYSIYNWLTLNLGLGFDLLEKNKSEENPVNYLNGFDVSLISGLSFFTSSRFTLYIRTSFGLLHLLDYYNIDALGNFDGEIHDLYNRSISIGVTLAIYNEKLF